MTQCQISCEGGGKERECEISYTGENVRVITPEYVRKVKER